MRIAMIHESEYAPYRWPRFTLIAENLRKAGNSVTIYSFGKSRDSDNGPRVVDLERGFIAYFLSVLAHVLSRRVVCSFGLTLPLIRHLSQRCPDIIIFHHAYVGFALLLAKQFLGWRSLLVYDWNDLRIRMAIFPRNPHWRYPFWTWLEERFIPRRSDRIIVVSSFAKKLVASCGVPGEKIIIVNELVPLRISHTAVRRRRNRRVGNRTMVWHGNIRPYQVPGVVTVIRALALLPPEKRPKVCIIGPFSFERDKERINNLAHQLGVMLELTGYVNRDVLDALLDSADAGIQVLPDDLFAHFINGVKLAEYVSHGLPVLCSRLEGPSELVNGNGILYDPDNPEELGAAIATLFSIRYPEFLDRAVEMAHREFSEEAILAKIAHLTAEFKRDWPYDDT